MPAPIEKHGQFLLNISMAGYFFPSGLTNTSETSHLLTDASNLGYGCVFGSKCFWAIRYFVVGTITMYSSGSGSTASIIGPSTSLFCFWIPPNLAASTTKTHIAALSFTFKLGNYQDLTQHFLVKKLLVGFTKLFCWCKTAYHAFNLDKINRVLAPHFKLNIY